MAEEPQAPPPKSRAEQLIDELWNDSSVGATLRAKAKEKFPDIVLPEDSFRPVIEPMRAELESTRAELKTIREEREAERQEAKDNASKRNLEQSLEDARQKYGLNAEGFDKMVARMKEKENFTDAESAAAWVRAQEPPPKAPGPSWAPQALNLFGSQSYDEQFALLHKDPQAYQDAQLQEFVSDPDRYVAETFGAA